MPQSGLKTLDQIGEASAVDIESYPSLPWTLPRAEVVQATFEVDLDAALETLPEQLTRPVPPYARMIVSRYPESPVGPYSEALLLLAARFAMMPKNYVVAAVVSTDAARDAYRDIWSLPVTTGGIELQRRQTESGGENVSASVASTLPLAAIELPDAYAVEPGMIRYDPLMSVRVRQGEAEVIQFSGAPAVHEARLAKGATVRCQTDDWSDPWFRLRSLNMISASFAVTDLEVTAPVVQTLRSAAGAMGGGLP
ncbi:MAG: acetoacetate decarboxylase family protein [Dehalococcoidia bacterium]